MQIKPVENFSRTVFERGRFLIEANVSYDAKNLSCENPSTVIPLAVDLGKLIIPVEYIPKVKLPESIYYGSGNYIFQVNVKDRDDIIFRDIFKADHIYTDEPEKIYVDEDEKEFRVFYKARLPNYYERPRKESISRGDRGSAVCIGLGLPIDVKAAFLDTIKTDFNAFHWTCFNLYHPYYKMILRGIKRSGSVSILENQLKKVDMGIVKKEAFFDFIKNLFSKSQYEVDVEKLWKYLQKKLKNKFSISENEISGIFLELTDPLKLKLKEFKSGGKLESEGKEILKFLQQSHFVYEKKQSKIHYNPISGLSFELDEIKTLKEFADFMANTDIVLFKNNDELSKKKLIALINSILEKKDINAEIETLKKLIERNERSVLFLTLKRLLIDFGVY